MDTNLTEEIINSFSPEEYKEHRKAIKEFYRQQREIVFNPDQIFKYRQIFLELYQINDVIYYVIKRKKKEFVCKGLSELKLKLSEFGREIRDFKLIKDG